MNEKVDPNNIDNDDLPDGVSKDDDLKQGPTDIDVNNRNGAAYESKNTKEFKPLYPDEDEYEELGTQLDELRKKLNTQAASGQDEIVVVMRQDQLNAKYSDEVTAEFPDSVDSVETPSDVGQLVEDSFDDVNVEFKSYSDVNYPDLPRSGLPGPRLLRSGLPVSVSELAGPVPTAAPDSAGDFPLQVVRSVPLLPVGHSATTDDARFLSRLNTAGNVVSIVLPRSGTGVVKPQNKAEENDETLYPHPTPLPSVAPLRVRA